MTEPISQSRSKVEHPSHYQNFPLEVCDIIRLVLGPEGYQYYCMGNELKYRLRFGFKDGEDLFTDVQKAMQYYKMRTHADNQNQTTQG